MSKLENKCLKSIVGLVEEGISTLIVNRQIQLSHPNSKTYKSLGMIQLNKEDKCSGCEFIKYGGISLYCTNQLILIQLKPLNQYLI